MRSSNVVLLYTSNTQHMYNRKCKLDSASSGESRMSGRCKHRLYKILRKFDHQRDSFLRGTLGGYGALSAKYGTNYM